MTVTERRRPDPDRVREGLSQLGEERRGAQPPAEEAPGPDSQHGDENAEDRPLEERPEEVVPEEQPAEGLGDVTIGGESQDDPTPRRHRD